MIDGGIKVQLDNGFTKTFQKPENLRLYDNGQTGKVLSTLFRMLNDMLVHSCHFIFNFVNIVNLLFRNDYLTICFTFSSVGIQSITLLKSK